MSRKKSVGLVGVPWCEGINLEGVDLAPTAMREAGLRAAVESLGLGVDDHGDVCFKTLFEQHKKTRTHDSIELYRKWLASAPETNFVKWVRDQVPVEGSPPLRTSPPTKRFRPSDIKEAQEAGAERLLFVNSDVCGEGLKLVHDAVFKAASTDAFVLTLGGDHSIASGSISALVQRYPELGVIWVNAHGDANTPSTSPSGQYHGMSAAHLLGWFDRPGACGDGVTAADLQGFGWLPASGVLRESKMAYIGLRDVDKEEGAMLRRSGVRVFTMRDIDKHGIARVCEMAIEAVDASRSCPIHLSLDIDAVDPHFVRGVGSAMRGGLTYREVHCICEEAHLSNRLVSMDLVEVNPCLDPVPNDKSMHGDNPDVKPSSPTVRLAIELVLSALGKQTC